MGSITVKQSYVLDNIERVTLRRKASGRLATYLDGRECSQQVWSLGARGLVSVRPDGRPVRVAPAPA